MLREIFSQLLQKITQPISASVRGFDPEKLTNDIRGRSEGRRVRGVWHGAAIDADLVMYSGTARSPRRPSPGRCRPPAPSVRSFVLWSFDNWFTFQEETARARAGLLYMAVGPAVGSLRADGDRGGRRRQTDSGGAGWAPPDLPPTGRDPPAAAAAAAGPSCRPNTKSTVDLVPGSAVGKRRRRAQLHRRRFRRTAYSLAERRQRPA